MLLRAAVRRFAKSPYEVLGLKPGATNTEIKAAFYKLAKTHHPDINPSNSERFKEIHTAYTSLISDPNKPPESAFDPGESYEFRQRARQDFTQEQARKEHEQSESTENDPSTRKDSSIIGTTWGREKIILGVILGVLMLRLLFAESDKQAGRRVMNRQFEMSVNEYAREVEGDDREYQEFVRKYGLDKGSSR